MVAQLAVGLACQAVCGGGEVALAASPGGLLLPPPPAPPGAAAAAEPASAVARADLAQRYAARWAYASAFLPAAGSMEKARDRLVLVVAFMVAGLHLAAASYPHLPWVVWSPSDAKHTMTLPDETRVAVEVGTGTAAGARRASFEVLGRAGLGFRVFGTDEVACRTEFPGGFRFTDRGITTVEFTPGGNAVRFTLPELRVSASSWSLGLGSVYDWRGSAHFVDEAGGAQCDLCFGHEGPDSVSGTVRDARGYETGRIHGSWLGPLVCDKEVLWRGPRQQQVPF